MLHVVRFALPTWTRRLRRVLLVWRRALCHALLTFCTFVLHSNLCGVGGVLDGLFALCGAGAWGYAAGILQTAVDSNGNLRNEYESSGEVNTANQELQQALNALSASSNSPVGEELTQDYGAVLDQRLAAGIMTWIEFGYACPPSLYSIVVMAYSCVLH